MAPEPDGQAGTAEPVRTSLAIPPGMYLDPASRLVLPQGARLASRARVAAALLLALVLFGVPLGIGYVAWSLFTWNQGRTPAQRILSLRCWLPEPRRVAGRDDMAVRQVLGFFLCGGLLWGFFVWLASGNRRSAGDLLAGTVVLYDPAEGPSSRVKSAIAVPETAKRTG